jgi:hypothetical protein
MASSHDTVSEALRTTLAAIVGGTGGYVYTPSMVKRAMFWPDEGALDPSLETIYLIRPGAKVTAPYDGYRLDRRQEFRILCCHRFTEPTDNPVLAEVPVREQIAADMEADVVQKIWADVRLGQPSIVIDAMCESWRTDFDWAVSSWVVVELRIVVRYQHPQDGR